MPCRTLLAWNGASFLRWHVFMSLLRSNSNFKTTFNSLSMLNVHAHLSSVPVIPKINSSIFCSFDYYLPLLAPVSWLLEEQCPHGNPSFQSDYSSCWKFDLSHFFFFLSKSLGNSFQSPLPYVSQNITDKIYIYYHLTIFALLGKDPQMTHSKLVTYHSVLYGLSI